MLWIGVFIVVFLLFYMVWLLKPTPKPTTITATNTLQVVRESQAREAALIESVAKEKLRADNAERKVIPPLPSGFFEYIESEAGAKLQIKSASPVLLTPSVLINGSIIGNGNIINVGGNITTINMDDGVKKKKITLTNSVPASHTTSHYQMRPSPLWPSTPQRMFPQQSNYQPMIAPVEYIRTQGDYALTQSEYIVTKGNYVVCPDPYRVVVGGYSLPPRPHRYN